MAKDPFDPDRDDLTTALQKRKELLDMFRARAGRSPETEPTVNEAQTELGMPATDTQTLDETLTRESMDQPDTKSPLEQAQKRRQKILQTLALAQMGSGIGRSIAAGYGGKVPEADFSSLREMAKLPVSEYEEKKETKEEQAARKLYKQRLKQDYPELEISGDVPTEALEKLIGDKSSIKAFQQSKYVTKEGDPAAFDPNTMTYYNALTKEPVDPKNLIRNYVKTLKDPRTGEYIEIRPGVGSVGTITKPEKAPERAVEEKAEEQGKVEIEKTPKMKPTEVYTALNPKQREFLNKKTKEFATETKDVRESLAKVNRVAEKAIDATKNPIAASQLGAEVATIYENGRLTDEDVKRYTRRLGIADRFTDALQSAIDGTITPEKAKLIQKTLTNYSKSTVGELSTKAENKANIIRSRVGSQFSSKELAPLVYGNYQNRVKVRHKESGKIGSIPENKLNEALESGLYERVTNGQ